MLECRDLTLAFGGLIAVNDLNLSVRQGEIIGLVGPNGSGKTSLFNLISGVYRAAFRREIVFDGRSLAGCGATRSRGSASAAPIRSRARSPT